jgi:large subunit ribosomal protein L4
MTSILVKDLKGQEVGTKELCGEVFDTKPNLPLMHSALVRQLANGRTGSANCKTRAEVRGGGRKPWRQKGTGRARVGSTRSPLWNGGGVIFGPKPRDYSISMPRKARQLALKSAFAARAGELVVVQNFDGLFPTTPTADSTTIEQPKTKVMNEVLKSLGIADKLVLIVLDYMVAGARQVERAARNLPNCKVVDHTNLSVKDLAYCQALLVTEQVLAELENRFKTCGASKNRNKLEAKIAACQASAAGASTGAARAKKAAKAAAEAVSSAKAGAAARKVSSKSAPEPGSQTTENA